jgi:hypothetical protein
MRRIEAMEIAAGPAGWVGSTSTETDPPRVAWSPTWTNSPSVDAGGPYLEQPLLLEDAQDERPRTRHAGSLEDAGETGAAARASGDHPLRLGSGLSRSGHA